jgi:hypothetical protein
VAQKVTSEAQLSYLHCGLSWRANYNLLLDELGDTLNLRSWASNADNTDKCFDPAKIKLIAGDVNKVKAEQSRPHQMKISLMATRDASPAPSVDLREFDEFHLYTLPLATTLRIAEPKQVYFVRAEQAVLRLSRGFARLKLAQFSFGSFESKLGCQCSASDRDLPRI